MLTRVDYPTARVVPQGSMLTREDSLLFPIAQAVTQDNMPTRVDFPTARVAPQGNMLTTMVFPTARVVP